MEDTTICISSPAPLPSKKSCEDLDDSLGGINPKITNDTDQASFPNSGETGSNEIEGEHFGSSVSKGTATMEIFKDTDVSVPYQVSSELKNSLDKQQSQSFNEDSVNNSQHLRVLVIDKGCDHNAVKDIWVDEGASSHNTKILISQNNFGLQKYKLSDSTHAKAGDPLPDVSFNGVAYQADVNNSLDFDSLLDLAEMGNNRTQWLSDHIVDKNYLDELLASANNPFLEDSHVETCREDEKEAANVAHPCNPFDFEGTLYEPEGNSNGPDETSNKFSAQSNFIEDVISSKNPFLDTSSFKSTKDDFNEAEKISGNDVTIEGDVKKEPATHDKEKTTTSDSTAEVPSIGSTVNTQGAGDKMTVPEQSDSHANGSQLQHDPLESSFASVNPYPALISYSGQIPFSGSMSLRSESSATSNRSFAFPVLQTDWKASPVRMAKANRKHSSWKHTLLCCNF